MHRDASAQPRSDTQGPQGGSWRLSLDRAWRTASVRRTFESECGLAPLAESEEVMREQSSSGHAEAYHDQFLLWATKYLGLEGQAPPSIQKRLSKSS